MALNKLTVVVDEATSLCKLEHLIDKRDMTAVLLEPAAAFEAARELTSAFANPASDALGEAAYAMREIADCIDKGESSDLLFAAIDSLGRACLDMTKTAVVIDLEIAREHTKDAHNLAQTPLGDDLNNCRHFAERIANEFERALSNIPPKGPVA